MGIELNNNNAVCSRCGTAYGRKKGNFLVNYGNLYKGGGYLTICKECVDSMYNDYLSKCDEDSRLAVRQMCRKLDLYWSDRVFNMVTQRNTNRTLMTAYIAKISTQAYIGKSYDDTLIEEKRLWDFGNGSVVEESDSKKQQEDSEEYENIPQELKDYWGEGFPQSTYDELEKKKQRWIDSLPKDQKLDIGTETILKQICMLEMEIDRDRAAGKATDKKVTLLNTLLGDTFLKPQQKKVGDGDLSNDKTPFGVWIKKFENEKPIPDPDPELQDTDGVIKYILTWFYGHLAKMVGIKNAHSKLYDKAIDDLRVLKPEYEDETDDELLYDIFGDTNNDSDDDKSSDSSE